jgi:cell division protease FtsH
MGDLFANSDGYLGGVVKANRALFARAAALSPSVLFLDELDALPNRASLDGRAREWWNTLITDMLILVSTAPSGIVILGATNYANHIDEALLRPGRLERVFEISLPKTAEALESVLRFHLRGDLAGDDLLPISRMALGTTPATIMDYVRTARRKATAAGRDMTLPDLAEVICPIDTRTLPDQKRTALHEAAHIVIAIVVGISTVRSASIIARGDTAGRVAIDGMDDLVVGSRDQVEAIVSVLLAGRCAEIALMNGPTGGAGGHPSSDLAYATRLVAAMHGSLGLAGKATYRGALGDLGSVMSFDSEFRLGVEDHLSVLAGKTELLVRQYRAEIMRVADLLMERRYVSADDVRSVMGTKMQEVAPPIA